MLNNDRQITISAAGNRNAVRWPAQTLYISELYDRLKTPARGRETLDQYLHLPKRQQDDLKDVGGYVGGVVHGGGRRKATAIDGRDILTLDMDHIPAGGTEDILRRVDSLGCGYCIYSTRKHSPDAPRLRIIIPLDRTVSADEYEPIARMTAKLVGIDFCDPSTFEAHRLMYWPSCCADSQYVYLSADKPFISANGMLGLYQDWRDVTTWPQVPGAKDPHKALAVKQGDPTAKGGIVGAFCRTYNIFGAMEKYLPGVYTPTDIPDRYTYAAGSTTGGAIIYDNGSFLFSHHATDPCSGRLVNAFDLVRLHLYSDQDDAAEPGTPTATLPSFTAMKELATEDSKVKTLMLDERYQEATKDFAGLATDTGTESENWQRLLDTNKDGIPLKTIDNIWVIMEHDPLLKGKFAMNEFANRGEVFSALPWDAREDRRMWGDSDISGVRWYLERTYSIAAPSKVDDAFNLHSNRHRFNDVVDYLTNLAWDGVPRLDALLIDYLGAPDTPYVRTVTRKAFTAAVARAMTPGVKFDVMTVLSGPQNIGKSTLLRKMSKGWFTDSLRTFEGKDASELIQGVWIVEVGELNAFRRTDINRVKQFLSQQTDRFRAAYARTVKDCPRRCVFFGTTNDPNYLQDASGNRRFWPIDVWIIQPKKDVFTQLDGEIDQLWAEAVTRWRLGEPLFLSKEMEAVAKEMQDGHMERDPLQGQIEVFLGRPIPEDWWQNWDSSRRGMFWGNGVKGDVKLVHRDRTCPAEIWQECMGNRFSPTKIDAHRINEILRSLPDWEYAGNMRFGEIYGIQKGFRFTGNRNTGNDENGNLVNLLTFPKKWYVNQTEKVNEKVNENVNAEKPDI